MKAIYWNEYIQGLNTGLCANKKEFERVSISVNKSNQKELTKLNQHQSN
jgi:hypothetical protein